MAAVVSSSVLRRRCLQARPASRLLTIFQEHWHANNNKHRIAKNVTLAPDFATTSFRICDYSCYREHDRGTRRRGCAGPSIVKVRRSFSSSSPPDAYEERERDETSPSESRRRVVLLNGGRARRKWEARRRREDAAMSDDDGPMGMDENTESIDPGTSSAGAGDARSEVGGEDTERGGTHGSEASNDDRRYNDDSALFGRPLSNPAGYQPVVYKYPKTLEGWRNVLNATWKDYIWTWGGFFTSEEKEKDRENESSGGKDGESASNVLRDKADQVADNVRKNVQTLQEETPKLIEMGKNLTGITTKEELRAWVGEQLKLATDCLTQFMKGYRTGRDDEVDRMLHEYFKDMDADDTQGNSAAAENGEDPSTTKAARLWGRKGRRKLKAIANKSPNDSDATAELTSAS